MKMHNRLAVLSLFVVALTPGVASASPGKVDACVLTGDGTYQPASVSTKAAPAIRAQGGAIAGDIVAGGEVQADCSTRFTSSSLSFGPNGWAGWSCPSGMTAVGGGHSLGSALVSEMAAAGAAYPHYTFGPNETGWVVRNDNDSETGTVYVDCV